VARHGAVRHASVTVEASDGMLQVLVADEGVGFELSAVRAGAGLGGMRECVGIGRRAGDRERAREGNASLRTSSPRRP
jgi:signal transduction histidine kinase